MPEDGQALWRLCLLPYCVSFYESKSNLIPVYDVIEAVDEHSFLGIKYLPLNLTTVYTRRGTGMLCWLWPVLMSGPDIRARVASSVK